MKRLVKMHSGFGPEKPVLQPSGGILAWRERALIPAGTYSGCA